MMKNKKLIYSLICNIITFYLTGLSNIWTQEQALKNKNIHPLQDQGFKLILYNEDLLFINDYVLIAIIVPLFILLFVHKQRWEILFRWSLMLNILFAMRVITIPSTILTRPVELDEEWVSCKSLDYDYNGLLGPFQMIFNGKMTCFDFIFSGHMVNTTIAALLLTKYLHSRLKYIFWVLETAEAYFIIATRSHYLVDVEIAFALTILLWYVLEYREEIKLIKKNNDNPINNNNLEEITY